MANSIGVLSFVQIFLCPFIFFNVVFLLAIVSHATSTNNDVSNICPKTTNPQFCTSLLKTAGSTDLKGLAIYTLNLAHINARKSHNLAKSLVVAATNPQLKEQYSSCSDNYDEAIGDIENAQKNLASGDFNGVNIATSGVMTTIDNCQDSFKQPPTDTSSLLKDGETLNDICSIILVISNLLPKSM